jgi:hypothetical protein
MLERKAIVAFNNGKKRLSREWQQVLWMQAVGQCIVLLDQLVRGSCLL